MPDIVRILIADDSRIVRSKIAQAVRDRFEVREAADGESAWQAILLDSSIRAAVIGLSMPKVDGRELILRVRASRLTRIRELPLAILAGTEEKVQSDRAAGLDASEVIDPGVGATELMARLEALIHQPERRPAPAEKRAAAEPPRTIDADTQLLSLPFFDRQVDKLISYSRRNVTDVSIVCVRAELTFPQTAGPEPETGKGLQQVGRALSTAIRLEDIATRSDHQEFCVAAQSDGVAGVLHFAARLRKILENAEIGGGGEVWTFIGVASLSEDMRLTAEPLRQISQKRAIQAQGSRSRRIVLGAGEGANAEKKARADEGTMDVNLALALIRSGRSAEVVPHLPRLVHQLRPLMALVRQQKELAQSKKEKETVVHDSLQGVPRTLDQ